MEWRYSTRKGGLYFIFLDPTTVGLKGFRIVDPTPAERVSSVEFEAPRIIVTDFAFKTTDPGSTLHAFDRSPITAYLAKLPLGFS